MGAKNYQADYGGGRRIVGNLCLPKTSRSGKKVILLDRDVREHIGGQAVESWWGIHGRFSPSTPFSYQRRFGYGHSIGVACRIHAADELASSARGFIENSTRLLYHGLKYHVSIFRWFIG